MIFTENYLKKLVLLHFVQNFSKRVSGKSVGIVGKREK